MIGLMAMPPEVIALICCGAIVDLLYSLLLSIRRTKSASTIFQPCPDVVDLLQAFDLLHDVMPVVLYTKVDDVQ